MKKIKLAILTFQIGPNNAALFREIAQQKNIDLTVYLQSDRGIRVGFDPAFGVSVDWGESLIDGFRCIVLKNFSFCPSDHFFGQINLSVIKELLYNRYDVVFVNGWNSFTNWLTFICSIILGTHIFLLSESSLTHEILKSKIKKNIKKPILNFLFRNISAFLYIGQENKRFYSYYHIPESKLFFFPYAANNDKLFQACEALNEQRSVLKEDIKIRGCPVILFVGRLVSQKRPFDILKAYEHTLSYLQEKNKKDIIPALVFVGDGDLREDLEMYVKSHNFKNVYFVGFQNKRDLVKYFALSDIFVLSSGVGETWGVVVNEAMCFGLPIVVSDMVGSRGDLVQHGKNGFVFPVGDIDVFSSMLIELVLDERKRKSFGVCSRSIIEQYNYKNDVLGLLSALGHVINN